MGFVEDPLHHTGPWLGSGLITCDGCAKQHRSANPDWLELLAGPEKSKGFGTISKLTEMLRKLEVVVST